jgi:hypothetical protein
MVQGLVKTIEQLEKAIIKYRKYSYYEELITKEDIKHSNQVEPSREAVIEVAPTPSTSTNW